MRINIDLSNVLVTGVGAPNGLGWHMACHLAEVHKSNLVITGKDEARLEELAGYLDLVHGEDVRVRTVVADLTRNNHRKYLVREATDGQPLTCAILNAGVTYYGPHAAITDEQEDVIIGVNIEATAKLTRGLLGHLDKRDGSALMFISSLGASTGLPYQALYAGSKAFINGFGRSLAMERNGTGRTSVTVFAPGGINTGMLKRSGLARLFPPGSFGIMEPGVCAALAIRAMRSRKRFVVPGAFNKAAHILGGLNRVIPGLDYITGEQLRKMYEKRA